LLKRIDRVILIFLIVFITVGFVIWVVGHVVYSFLQVSSLIIDNWLISTIIFTFLCFIALMLWIDNKESSIEEQKGLNKFIMNTSSLVANFIYKIRDFIFSTTDQLLDIIVWLTFIGISVYIIYLIYAHIIKPIMVIF